MRYADDVQLAGALVPAPCVLRGVSGAAARRTAASARSGAGTRIAPCRAAAPMRPHSKITTMTSATPDLDQLHHHLLNALEQERGAIEAYRAALPHAGPASRWLRWRAALEEAQRHEAALRSILADLDLDAEHETPARAAVRAVGAALRRSLHEARGPAGRRTAAEACVRLLERRERGHWELLGQLLSPPSAPVRSRPRRAPAAAAHPGLERAAAWRLQRERPAARPARTG